MIELCGGLVVIGSMMVVELKVTHVNFCEILILIKSGSMFVGENIDFNDNITCYLYCGYWLVRFEMFIFNEK